jgi:hypothetical protein
MLFALFVFQLLAKRTANPSLPEEHRQALVNQPMDARRA